MSARTFYDAEGVLLLDAHTAGDAPVWIQIAKMGMWLGHPAGPFELTRKTFGEIIANFDKTRNHEIAIDYEHASEQPATSGTIPTGGAPAQGWIRELKIEGDGLWGLVQWLPQARDQIRAKQYKYLSPAIRFGTKDRETNKPAGAFLSSAALTNIPFLDGMAPLTAKDNGRTSTSLSGRTAEIQIAEGLPYSEAIMKAAEELRAPNASASPEGQAHQPTFSSLSDQLRSQGLSYTDATVEASRQLRQA